MKDLIEDDRDTSSVFPVKKAEVQEVELELESVEETEDNDTPDDDDTEELMDAKSLFEFDDDLDD